MEVEQAAEEQEPQQEAEQAGPLHVSTLQVVLSAAATTSRCCDLCIVFNAEPRSCHG